MILGWALFLGCPQPPESPPTPPTPAIEDTGPVLDTGLPAPSPPQPAVSIGLGEVMLCPDVGRDVRYYDPIYLGEAGTQPRRWDSSGLIIDDFDGDGSLDLLAPGLDRAQLWIRTPTGWVDRAATILPEIDIQQAVGGSTADFDGDGDPDIYITRYDAPGVLLRNDGGVFTDISEDAGLSQAPSRATSASWADFDGDGWLDLFVGGYGATPEDAWELDMAPGDPSQLLRNNGDGSFTDLSASLPQSVHDSYTFQSAWYDIDEDGFPELFLLQDFGWIRPSVMLWNRAGTLELDDGTAGFHPNFAGMGLAVGDLNDDLIPDFAQTSFEDVSLLLSTQTAFATDGVAWTEFADAMGFTIDLDVWHQVYGWGAELGDLDNDRDLDLVVGFGKWDEYLNYDWQYDGIWTLDEGQFSQRAAGSFYDADDRGATRGVLLVDLDGDGWLDIVKRMLDEPLTIHRSRCNPSRHFTRIALRDPTSPNTHAIGARVTLTVAGERLTRWVDAGSRSMFSGGPAELHFGLGDELIIEHAEVRWPDGEVQLIRELPVDRRIEITRLVP